MTPEQWLRFRKKGIGASEVGTVMGLNQYKASIELFYEKISPDVPYSVENIHTFMGKYFESQVAELWQYWEGSEESMIYNYSKGNIIRRCRRVNAYVQNPKYPWLFVSLDRQINRHDDKDNGALEVKTIMGYEADKWEAGIPPSHVVQVQDQCLVCEFKYGELATLTNGRRFDVTPFDINKAIAKEVIEQTREFWERVVKARVIITQQYEARRKHNMRLVEDLGGQLAMLEPPPDNTEAYANYLKARYNKTVAGERAGTLAELAEAKKHRDFCDRIMELSEYKRGSENKLKAKLGEMEKLVFPGAGFISWKADTNGVRKFINKVA